LPSGSSRGCRSPGKSLTRAASSGAAALAARYLFVGLLNLGATTLLVRHLGPAKWASYGVALFLANFMDQYLGSKLLGAVIASDQPSPGLIRAGAYLMQLVGRIGILIAVLAMLPAARLTALHSPVLMCAASAACGYVYVSRALPSALMERRLEYRLIGIGEVLDQVTFTILAVALVLGGLGLPGVMLALAVQGIPTLVLWRRHTRPTPFLGKRTPELSSILRYAVPGSGVAVCVLVEGIVPIIAFSFAHARLLGLAITSSSMLSYPGVAVLVLQRIAFPAFARTTEPERLDTAIEQVARACSAILIATEGVIGLTSPLWLPWLFGSRWHGAWPLTCCYAACYVFLGQINVIVGALVAAGRPRGALFTWAWMALPWVVGAALWMAFGKPVWLVGVLIGARVLGFGAGVVQLRRAGQRVRLAPEFFKSSLAAAAIVGGAAAVSAHRTSLIVAALALLVAVELVALWQAREPLRALAAGALQRSSVELSH
jgi:hypothetical protein